MQFVRRRRRQQLIEDRDPETVRALLDFGSSNGRALIARLTPNGVEVLGTGEAKGHSGVLREGKVIRHHEISKLIERALSAAESDTARHGGLPYIADDAIVGLTGSFLLSDRNIKNSPRSNPIAPIYEAEMIEILRKVQGENLAKLSHQMSHSKIRRTLVASQLVGAMSIRRDTRQAERISDLSRGIPALSGDFLSLAICNLTWPKQGLELLGRVLEDLELNLTDVIPIAQAIAVALPSPDAILIDIGYEHTEISLVERAALSHLLNIPFGGEFFTQQLIKELHLSKENAELVKQEHAQSKGLSGGRPVSRVLRNAARVWLQKIEQILLKLAGDAPLPPRLYLFGGGALLPELLEELRAQAWTRRLPFIQHPIIETLMPDHLRGLNDPRGILTAPKQVGIAALAAWAGWASPPLQKHLEELTINLAPRFELL